MPSPRSPPAPARPGRRDEGGHRLYWRFVRSVSTSNSSADIVDLICRRFGTAEPTLREAQTVLYPASIREWRASWPSRMSAWRCA